MRGASVQQTLSAQTLVHGGLRALISVQRKPPATTTRVEARQRLLGGVGCWVAGAAATLGPASPKNGRRVRFSSCRWKRHLTGRLSRPNENSTPLTNWESRPSWRPKQSLGQNFLQDRALAKAIVDAVAASAPSELVEIGTGTGVLTEPLLELFPQLLSLDIDERAVQHTRIRIAECGRFPLESVPQLQSRVQRADFLRQSWMSEYDRGRDTGPQVTLVGNLPYYIVSPILFHCFEHVHLYRRAFFMVQREFAERISAQPRCKDYGVLSVLAQLYAQTETLFQVPRTAFYPVPKVDSVVLRLELHRLSVTNDTSCRISTTNFDLALRQVVRQAFQQRRKTLRNVLGDGLPRQWRHCRAEELEPFDYLELAAWSLRDKECGLLDELHAPTTTDEDRHKPAR